MFIANAITVGSLQRGENGGGGGGNIPSNTGASPSASGFRVSGEKITMLAGGWSETPTAYTFTPYINGVAQTPIVVNVDTADYTIVWADSGLTFTFEVTATNGAGTSAPVSGSNSLTIHAGVIGNWDTAATGTIGLIGSTVASHTDKAVNPNVNTLTQSIVARQPVAVGGTVGGRNAFSYDGTDDGLGLPQTAIDAAFGGDWFLITSVKCDNPTRATFQSVFGAMTASSGQTRVLIGLEATTGNWQVRCTDTSTTVSSTAADTNECIIAAQKVGSTIKLILNGVVIATAAAKNVSSTNATSIGRRGDGGGGWFDGLIGQSILVGGSGNCTDAIVNSIGAAYAAKTGLTWTGI